jgi:hypothetical protein
MIRREIAPDRYADTVQQDYRQGVEAAIEYALARLG